MTETDGPIVARVREARARFAAECNHDLERMAQRLREIEKAHADRLHRPQRKPLVRPDPKPNR